MRVGYRPWNFVRTLPPAPKLGSSSPGAAATAPASQNPHAAAKSRRREVWQAWGLPAHALIELELQPGGLAGLRVMGVFREPPKIGCVRGELVEL